MPRSPSANVRNELVRQWLALATHDDDDRAEVLREAHDHQRPHSTESVKPETKRRKVSEKNYGKDIIESLRARDGRNSTIHESAVRPHASDAALLKQQLPSADLDATTEPGPSHHAAFDGNADVEQAEKALQHASEKYSRRRRHKIREGRYDYNPKHTAADAKRESRAKEKRNPHKKTGDSLHRDFKAPNVGSERLTLKQEAMPGIFSKGKASVPTERRGIPDLTFSEMTFLNKKRSLGDARLRTIQAISNPGSKNKGGAAEVSEYFSKPQTDESDIRRSRSRVCSSSIRSNQRLSTDERPNELKTRADEGIRSPEFLLTDHEPFHQHHLSAHGKGAEKQHLVNRSVVLKEQPESPSCVSWSTSPARHRAPPVTVRQNPPTSNCSKPGVQAMYRSGLASVHPRSSASNPDPRIEQPQQSRDSHPQQNVCTVKSRSYYALEDLKELAKEQAIPDDRHYFPNRSVAASSGLERIELPVLGQFFDRPALQTPRLFRPDVNLMPQPISEVAGVPRFDRQHQSVTSQLRSEHGVRGDNSGTDWNDIDAELEIQNLELLHGDLGSGNYLDQFDHDLLTTERISGSQSRLVSDLSPLHDYSDETKHMASWSAQTPLEIANITDRVAMQDSHASSVEHQHPQLLRPSLSRMDDEYVFKGFSTPRLLY